MARHWIGLDIGGANLKASDGAAHHRSRPFPLWKAPERLADELSSLLIDLVTGLAEKPVGLAVTMTGELCDGYSSKTEGVLSILDAVETVVHRHAGTGEPTLGSVRVQTTDGRLVSIATARANPRAVAAANWRVLAEEVAATWDVGDDQTAWIIDCGSTTTDILPLRGREVGPVGRTDTERLIRGELIYVGVERTPLSGLLPDWVTLAGHRVGMAREFFATIDDAILVLGQTETESDPEPLSKIASDSEPTLTDRNHPTADGRPRTAPFAAARLARMVCADPDELADLGTTALTDLATAAVEAAITRIAEGATRMIAFGSDWPGTVIVSGHGETLVLPALKRVGLLDDPDPSGSVPTGAGPPRRARLVHLRTLWGEQAARCGPAVALARRARRLDPESR